VHGSAPRHDAGEPLARRGAARLAGLALDALAVDAEAARIAARFAGTGDRRDETPRAAAFNSLP
jgi:hypothetical protein